MSNNEFAAFEALDLAPIKMKLMHVESGEGWSAARAEAVEMEYRRFLFLMKKYPDGDTSPSVDVDTFWHYHILDTMKYAVDCEAVFGYFLHHYPYVGMGEGADDSERELAGERMRAIYEAEFGARTEGGAAWCGSPGKPVSANQGSAWCGAPGKKVDAMAWCGSPGKKVDATAWCGSPGKKLDATAWCGSPGKKVDATAWCGSPGKKLDATAWCGSPGKKLGISAAVATAWCGSPAKPAAGCANETAWCGSPGKEVAQAA